MRLPSLKALQAFEAAGRLESFQKAAAEMAVTPGAVSKQIQLLEQQLGRQLFARAHRSVALTPAGRAYLAEVGAAFDRLQHATRRVERVADGQPLRVHCSSLFMQHWLTPRLASLRDLHPELEVTINVGSAREALPADADVGIRLGGKRVAGFSAHRLLDVKLVPVCSPAYLAASGALRSAEDFSDHVLLGSLLRPQAWRDWLRAAGTDASPSRMMSFPDASTAYHAALKGVGIALVYEEFARTDLAEGLLVKPFDFAVRYDEAYYLLYPKANGAHAGVRKFRSWILAQTRRAAPGPRPNALLD